MRYDEDGVMKLPLLHPQVQNLSGGELQRVALTLCLGKPADVYLIDEPSAYLDSEQRLMAARVIKRYALLSLLLKQLCSPSSCLSSHTSVNESTASGLKLRISFQFYFDTKSDESAS